MYDRSATESISYKRQKTMQGYASGWCVLGLLFLSSFSIQLWKRKTDCGGDVAWELGRTIDLHTLLPPGSDGRLSPTIGICGFAEDDNVLLLRTRADVFMIQLESMQLKKPFGMHISHDETNIGICGKLYLPFTCVYSAGNIIIHLSRCLVHHFVTKSDYGWYAIPLNVFV